MDSVVVGRRTEIWLLNRYATRPPSYVCAFGITSFEFFLLQVQVVHTDEEAIVHDLEAFEDRTVSSDGPYKQIVCLGFEEDTCKHFKP